MIMEIIKVRNRKDSRKSIKRLLQQVKEVSDTELIVMQMNHSTMDNDITDR